MSNATVPVVLFDDVLIPILVMRVAAITKGFGNAHAVKA
jgi:hypothetical protein